MSQGTQRTTTSDVICQFVTQNREFYWMPSIIHLHVARLFLSRPSIALPKSKRERRL